MPLKAKLNLSIQPFDRNSQTVEFFFKKLSDLQKLNNLRSLQNLKLDSNESFKFFSYRHDEQLRLAYPKFEPAALDSVKFTDFLQVLHKQIKRKILVENNICI